MSVYHFIGFIYKLGVNRCVDVPKEIADKLGHENFIPVKIKTHGYIKQSNLIPSGEGNFRVFLDSEIRKRAGKDAGEFIEIQIERDNDPRDSHPPEDLEEALLLNKTAKTIYDSSTVNKQREILAYLNAAKTKDTRLKRIDYIISILLQEASKRKRK